MQPGSPSPTSSCLHKFPTAKRPQLLNCGRFPIVRTFPAGASAAETGVRAAESSRLKRCRRASGKQRSPAVFPLPGRHLPADRFPPTLPQRKTNGVSSPQTGRFPPAGQRPSVLRAHAAGPKARLPPAPPLRKAFPTYKCETAVSKERSVHSAAVSAGRIEPHPLLKELSGQPPVRKNCAAQPCGKTGGASLFPTRFCTPRRKNQGPGVPSSPRPAQPFNRLSTSNRSAGHPTKLLSTVMMQWNRGSFSLSFKLISSTTSLSVIPRW